MSQTLPKSDDLSATWTFVEPGLQFILGADNDAGVSAKMYMNVYTAIYNYCVNKSRSTSNNNFNNTTTTHSSLLVGGEIYSKLNDYLIDYVKSLKQSPDETFLQFYVRKWKRFTMGGGYLNNVFDYMNRYWVQKERSDGRRDIYDVNTLCLLTWKEHMFNIHHAQLVKEILKQIELQRKNQIINTDELSTAVKSFVHLGIDIQDLKKTNLVVYVNFFENQFLESSAKFYKDESNEYLKNHNITDYMLKCESRLSDEASKSSGYLDDHSKRLLYDTLNKALIENHAETMYTQFVHLLEQNETENILRMFKLLSRVPATLDPLAVNFENYIKDEGLKSIDNLKNSELEVSKGPINPKTYIKTLIGVHAKFEKIVAEAFDKSPKFVKALDSACRNFINKNSIATPNPRASSRTPEFLAKYGDILLKKSSKESDIADMNVDELMTVFKFLNDKDSFEINYRRLLAKRLIHGTTSSDEAEESIIQKLQNENSLEYTSKMTKMFQDMQASSDLKILFQEKAVGPDYVQDFNPMILAETMWPFTDNKLKLTLPKELMETSKKLEEIYTEKHNGRQLKWLWHLCRGEIKANLARKGKPPFVFVLSLFQMAIVLPFNEKPSYTFDELLEITSMAPEYLEGHIAPLIKYKLLVQSPPNPEAIKDGNTLFTIVPEYKSKKMKVNFSASVKIEQRQEDEDTQREIDEDRKMFLQACIVRIMKARKEIKHSSLINEVIQQSHSRFSAQVSDIKKCIDKLIEREYLRRVDNDGYEYLA